MRALMSAYRALRSGDAVDIPELDSVVAASSLLEIQASSLLALLLSRSDTSCRGLIENLLARFPGLNSVMYKELRSEDIECAPDVLPQLVHCLRRGEDVGANRWEAWAHGVSTGSIPAPRVAFGLMEIAQHRLSQSDLLALSRAMRDSGSIYDYRLSMRPRRLVRRYPTGALSEKAALILPSLIAAAARDLPIASNFLVAKSLGYTGGTWDKLSAIPGFRFPSPGREAEEILRRDSVVMCVTSDDVAPCDRVMYQIRSLTGSIESHDLIVSSIASKQAAIPADLLLLDVRYGDGAFIPDQPGAEELARSISQVLQAWNLTCEPAFTPTDYPTGSAIGNAIEIAEAIAVMRGAVDSNWNQGLLNHQWSLVERFFARLMEMAGHLGSEVATQYARELRVSGRVLGAFKQLLTSHGVDSREAESIVADPLAFFYSGNMRLPVRAPRSGRLHRIDQRELGATINFRVAAGGNEFGGQRDLLGGCLLSVVPPCDVVQGDVLCWIIGSARGLSAISSSVLDEVGSCFEIDPTRCH